MAKFTEEQLARLDELDAGLATAKEILQTAGQKLRDLADDLAQKHKADDVD